MRRQLHLGSHIPEDTLEEYALGRVPESQSSPIEEHLLVCESCQKRLGDIDEYILLMKHATSQPHSVGSPASKTEPWRSKRVRYIVGGTIAAGLAAAIFLPQSGALPPAEKVDLVAMRGAEMTHIHAGRPVDFHIELPDLLDGTYRIDVVDSGGRVVWSGPGSARGKELRVREPKALKAGVYWVRLFAAGGDEVREFGLESAPISN